MPKSFTLTIDGDSTPEAVTIPTDTRCSSVELWSKDADVTGGVYVYIPNTSATPILRSEGERVTIASPAAESIAGGFDFAPGQIVAYLKTVAAGPFAFQVVCQ